MVTREEISTSLFEMGPLKAPREDGYPTLFLKHNRANLQSSLISYI